MAYWQFDLTFVNLAALPAGAHSIVVYAMISVSSSGGLSFGADVPATGNLDFTTSTAAPEYGNPFELPPEAKVWFEVSVMNDVAPPNPPETLGIYLLGPYTVGEIGTEVPAP